MGRWGTRTYVNCYFTHIIGVSLLCLSPLGQLCLFYMHLYLFYSILLFCIATLLYAAIFLKRSFEFLSLSLWLCSSLLGSVLTAVTFFLFPIIENGEECCICAWFSFRSFFAPHASKKNLFSRDSKDFKKKSKNLSQCRENRFEL